jgi:HK97 family phage major capsid protein
MQEILNGAEREERPLSAEERTNFDTAEKDLEGLTADIERAERTEKLETRTAEITEEERAARQHVAPGRVEAPADAEKRYDEAFTNFMRRGINGVDTEDRSLLMRNFASLDEQRAQGIATSSAGGYFVPQGFRAVVTETMKAYGGLLNVANVITTDTGNPLPWPGVDDTGNVGAILAENTQVANQDITITQNTLNAYTYTSKQVLVSLQLLQDSAFDLNTYVPRELGIRIGRAVAAHLVTGTGSSQPTGLFNAPPAGQTSTGQTGQTTSITYNDLINVIHKVDPAYRAAGDLKWLMADSTLAAIRKLVDSQGHPLWQPSLMAGVPDNLLGYPVVVDNGVATMAANAYSVAFGDFTRGMLVRQVLGVQMLRLEERYADFLQVGFIGFNRLDAKPDDAKAVSFYRNSAT